MATTHFSKKPTFFWQGLLIVLPVMALAVVGLFALRQDKILAQHESVERAQSLADELSEKIWTELTSVKDRDPLKHPVFQIDSNGQLLSPPPFNPLPIPLPFGLAELDDQQRQLWLSAQTADLGERNPTTVVKVLQDFLESKPLEYFAATAHFGLGILLARQGKLEAAADKFDFVLEKYPHIMGETGIPLHLLAQLKLLELAPRATNAITRKNFVSPEVFCSNAVFQPTPLTPFLLKTMADKMAASQSNEVAKRWQQLWERQELSRRLFAAALPHLRTEPRPSASLLQLEATKNQAGTNNPSLPTPAINLPNTPVPRFVWFNTQYVLNDDDPALSATSSNGVSATESEQRWLAARLDDDPKGPWFFCRSGTEVNLALSDLVKSTKSIPEYFGVSVGLAGRGVISSNNLPLLTYAVSTKGGGQRWTRVAAGAPPAILATAKKVENGTEQLLVAIHLISPEMLFDRQRARTFWFGLLIGVSAITAIVGLLAAWRAFAKQQRLSEMKSNFVSSVSHELRAPIASVRLLAEGLERGKIQEPEKQSEYFRFIVQECRRLSSLIENVLDFARIEQGRKQYDFEPTDLVALVQQTIKLMDPGAVEKGVKLETSNIQHSTSNIELAIDGHAIQQALVNLLDNAIKHSPDGSIVTVGLEFGHSRTGVAPVTNLDSGSSPSPKSNGENNLETAATAVLLWVEDHGNGIPPADHEKIFERFYRCGSELRRETQGVGIGLSIVKHVVEAHGGKVIVRSAVGQGSRFTIELPMQKAPNAKLQ